MFIIGFNGVGFAELVLCSLFVVGIIICLLAFIAHLPMCNIMFEFNTNGK